MANITHQKKGRHDKVGPHEIFEIFFPGRGSINMVMSTVRIVVLDEKFNEVLKTIKYILERFRVKTGCIHCRAYQDIENPQALVFEDRWETQDALKSHIRSADYQIMLSLMEMSLQPPEIDIYSCLAVSGIDFIGNIRAGQGDSGIC